jgi:tetratricopeptide (TPR) repeat protein
VRAAMAGAAETLKLAQQPTSERIRSRLYSLAAEFTTTAAFACIDSLALAEAQTHLNRAAILAGLSRSSVVQAQVWNLFSMAAFYDGRPSEAVTAAQAAADKLTRSDPEFAALGFARAAHGYAAQGDRQAALRSIGRAFDLLDRTTNVEPRPSWAAFLGRGEIEALAARLYHQLNIPQKAEEASHRALSVTPLGFQRNRAQVTFHLAKAQLRQGEPELACVSARDVLNSVGGEPLPRRLLTLATEFHRELVATVPTLPAVSEWREVARLRQRGQA